MLSVRRHRPRGVLVTHSEAVLQRTISSSDTQLLDAVTSAWLRAQTPALFPGAALLAMAVRQDGALSLAPDGSNEQLGSAMNPS